MCEAGVKVTKRFRERGGGFCGQEDGGASGTRERTSSGTRGSPLAGEKLQPDAERIDFGGKGSAERRGSGGPAALWAPFPLSLLRSVSPSHPSS